MMGLLGSRATVTYGSGKRNRFPDRRKLLQRRLADNQMGLVQPFAQRAASASPDDAMLQARNRDQKKSASTVF
jgi:hypothetical protein